MLVIKNLKPLFPEKANIVNIFVNPAYIEVVETKEHHRDHKNSTSTDCNFMEVRVTMRSDKEYRLTSPSFGTKKEARLWGKEILIYIDGLMD